MNSLTPELKIIILPFRYSIYLPRGGMLIVYMSLKNVEFDSQTVITCHKHPKEQYMNRQARIDIDWISMKFHMVPTEPGGTTVLLYSLIA